MADDWGPPGRELLPGPKFSPSAITQYARLGNKRPSESLLLDVRQHLYFLGWKIECSIYKPTGTCFRFRYYSPDNTKVYYSLRMLCRDLRDPIPVSGCSHNATARKRKRNSDGSSQLPSAPNMRKLRSWLEGNQCSRVLRSSTAARHFIHHQIAQQKCPGRSLAPNMAPCSSTRNHRTCLSWLIDNNVVSEGEKVHYRGTKSCSQLAVGRITREGIKCECCQTIVNLTTFEAHAGRANHRPAANILLEDGRTLLDCQKQVERCHIKAQTAIRKLRIKYNQARQQCRKGKNEDICSVCHYGGDLILCANCPSSFHQSCLGLEDIPDEEWFCFSCCCHICKQIKFKKDVQGSSHARVLNCNQCRRRYHAGCLKDKRVSDLEGKNGNWFCNDKCEDIFIGLQKLTRRQIVLGEGRLIWTLVKSSETDICDYNKLSAAVKVMHDCFEPVKDAYTGRDIAEDIIYGRGSDLKRSNHNGFYVVLLERDDDLITAATLRIWGDKVAEIPLVGTRVQYRRLGMCRILMDELEKQLVNLGVERLVLPSVSSTVGTWVNGFGFSVLTECDRKQYVDFTFVNFQGTIMCQKVLERNTKVRA